MIHRNFIGGEWTASNEAAPNVNPSDTTDIVGEYSRANASQVKMAIAAAKQAFPAWASVSPQVGADALDKVGNEMHDVAQVRATYSTQRRCRHGDGEICRRQASTITCRSAAARSRAMDRRNSDRARRSASR
jgi:acyl-CoA reductase-like NAD-dependent aldehyde dehydrogenase